MKPSEKILKNYKKLCNEQVIEEYSLLSVPLMFRGITDYLDEVDGEDKSDLENKKCEHNLIDFNYTGAWGSSVPPPNKKCTKCLMEARF